MNDGRGERTVGDSQRVDRRTIVFAIGGSFGLGGLDLRVMHRFAAGESVLMMQVQRDRRVRPP